jgi:drug/metabolite transporter (DMT)-like permease
MPPAASSPASTARVHLALLTVAALFSLNYIVSKVAMRAFNPIAFAYLRVLGAALVMQFVLPRDRTPMSKTDERALIGFAILGVVLNQTLFLAGLAFTSAHIAAILITAMPVFALGAAIVVGRERATAMKIGGILFAAAGALLVVGFEGVEGTTRSLIGAILIIINSLSFAMYLVLSKPMMARLTARRVIRRMFVVSAIVMIPIAAFPLARQTWTMIPREAWLGLAFVIMGPSVVAYLLNAWALTHAESSLVATYTYVQPVLTAILAAAFLHEHIKRTVIVAAAMIFAGVYLAGLRERRRQ